MAGQLGSEQAGFGLKQRDWNDRALLVLWRERWAEMANARLAELGHDLRIDHRSNAARGIELEPQNKIGPAGARRAVRGEDAERAAEHRAIARRNGERLLAEPGLALGALTQGQSTFTRHDLARLVSRQSDGAEQFIAVMARVEASPELVRVGRDGRGRDRFSTREMVGIERRMIAAAVALNKRTTHRVDAGRRMAVVDGQASQLSEEQALAYLHATRSRDLAVVVGIAGGGKSTLLGPARQVWEAQGYRVRGAALSGIAAEGLEGSAGAESRTLASWEHAWEAGKELLTARDVLVVDEAGMIGSRQLGRLLERVQAAGAKLVLVGDTEQLQAIEAGAAFRAIADQVGAVAITEPRRQQHGWQRQATKELASAHTEAALGRYGEAGMLHRHATREATRAGVVAGWDQARRADPGGRQIILAHERVDVRALNEAARAVRRAAGELGPDHTMQTELGPRAFAVGERLYFLKNDRGLGVKNGTLGTLERINGAADGTALGGTRLTVRLDGPDGAGTGRAVTVELAAYAELDHGYAATVHKSQGLTVDGAHVLATPGMDRHLVYVAMSRHRHAVQLHWAADEFGSPARLAAQLGRERAKDTTLDYAEAGPDAVLSYAECRGLDPLRPTSEIVLPLPTPPRAPAAAAPTPPTSYNEWPDGPRPQAVPQPASRPGASARPLGVIANALAALARYDAAQAAQGQKGAAPAATSAPPSPLARLPPAPLPPARLPPAPLPPALWPWDLVPPEAEPPAPLLPAVSHPPLTAADVAAAVEADHAVGSAREWLAERLERAYRDPGQAAARLAELREGMGTQAVFQQLGERPDVLGKLRGSDGFFASGDRAVERYFAVEAVGHLDGALNRRSRAEYDAAVGYRTSYEKVRHAEAVAVPGLSRRALLTVEAVLAAGATPGWREPSSPEACSPSADDVARAARVRPVWAAVMADPTLRGELQRFMAAAEGRLPDSYHLPPSWAASAKPAGEAQRLSAILHAARDLYLSHPNFQAHVAAERRQRQEQELRDAAERQAAVARNAEAAARRKAEGEAKAARLANQRFRPRPSPGPGM